MKFGKELKFSNAWYRAKYGNEAKANVCSPLLFSCVFDNEYFIDKHSQSKFIRGDGISINQENMFLRDYFNTKLEAPFEQYNCFEANGKFNISPNVIKDVWTEHPQEKDYSEYGELYIYYLGILNQNGFHKVAMLQTHDACYYIDSNQNNVSVFEIHEFIEKFHYSKVNNLSVMMNPVTGEWMKYKLSDFTHIIS